MINVTSDSHFIYISGTSSIRHLMTDYFDAVYVKTKKCWRLPKNHWVCSELWKEFPEIRKSRNFLQIGMECKRQYDELVALRQTSMELEGLRPYQVEDVSYLIHLEAGGIFNEPRTGKTPISITLIRLIGGDQNLVICPASLVPNWKREVEKWYPEGVDKVTVVSKDYLKGHLNDYLKDWDVVIVDEAHFLRNFKTLQSKAVFKVGKKAKRRYALTGTPAINHASDVIPILMFLYPNHYPSYWQVVDRYFNKYEVPYKPAPELGDVKKHRENEFRGIVEMVSVQRKRREVMRWLPEKQYVTLECEMDAKQRKLYKQMKEEFIAMIEDNVQIADGDLSKWSEALESEHVVHASTELVQLIRLRQLALDPRLLGFDVVGAKTKLILDYLENVREPIVIMSMFTSYLKMLGQDIEKKLKLKVDYIHGQMSNKDKDRAVTEFQEGKVDVLLCNIISAGVGFTLDRSNKVLFSDRAWTPAENEQAEDRVCPTSEERNHSHFVIDVVCNDSVDQRLHKILLQKKSLTDIINEGRQSIINLL